MKKKPIIITIENYGEKTIRFLIPSDAEVGIFRQAGLTDLFHPKHTYNNIEICIEHEGIIMQTIKKDGEA